MDLLRLPGLRVFQAPRFRVLVAALICALAGVRLAASLEPALNNMQDYRAVFIPSATAAWRGVQVYHQIPLAVHGELKIGGYGAIDTPVFLFLMWPWTVLGDIQGRLLWETLQVGAMLGIPLAVWGGLGRPTRAEALATFALLLLLPSLKDSLDEGQVSIFLGLLVALATLAHQRGRPIPGGIALGLAAAIKLTPGLLLPYFAWRRDWKMCAATVVTAGVLCLGTIAAGWARLWLPFVGAVRQISAGTANAQNQSINGALMRLLAPDRYGDPVAPMGLGFQLLQYGLDLALLGALVWGLYRVRLPQAERLWTQVSVILLVLPLIQPFAWFHHWAWAALAIPVTVHLASRRMLAPWAASIAGLAFTTVFLFSSAIYHATAAAAPNLGAFLSWASSLLALCVLLVAGSLALGTRRLSG